MANDVIKKSQVISYLNGIPRKLVNFIDFSFFHVYVRNKETFFLKTMRNGREHGNCRR